MKRTFICACTLLTLFAKPTYAQKDDKAVVQNITKANIFLPGLAREYKLGNASTLFVSAYMNIWISRTTSFYGGRSTAIIGPALDVSFRNYYNYKRRSGRGLRTEMNSMNYLAPAYTITAIKNTIGDRVLVNLLGAVWGMQRNYRSRFSIDFNIGAGYLFNAQGYANDNTVQPMSELTLGVWLNKKKN